MVLWTRKTNFSRETVLGKLGTDCIRGNRAPFSLGKEFRTNERTNIFDGAVKNRLFDMETGKLKKIMRGSTLLKHFVVNKTDSERPRLYEMH